MSLYELNIAECLSDSPDWSEDVCEAIFDVIQESQRVSEIEATGKLPDFLPLYRALSKLENMLDG